VLFNSPEFLLLLPIVFGLYWFGFQRNLNKKKQQRCDDDEIMDQMKKIKPPRTEKIAGFFMISIS
jgi:hypothetical protein